MIAALYVDPRGPYPTVCGCYDRRAPGHSCSFSVDCWDESRDARKYDGPYPVVAHPPCGPWGRLRHLYRGSEHDCAPRAVEQVRRWGGVLEHPAGSLLWKTELFQHLPAPGETDGLFGYTIEVDQCEWGHVARKRTWLYLVGVPREALERPPFPGREPTHWIGGFRNSSGRSPEHYAKNGCAVPPGIKVCSAQQRRRTPPLFAEYLVRLAKAVSKCL